MKKGGEAAGEVICRLKGGKGSFCLNVNETIARGRQDMNKLLMVFLAAR
jgi:hypothetical protein